MSKNIFVYGSLMFPEIVEALTGRQIEMVDAVLDGYKRYQIFDGDEPRSYPAIQKTEGESVTGRILLNVDEEDLQILDYFEDVGYDRKTERVVIDGVEVEVEVYTWPEDLGREINGELKGEWGERQSEEFRKKYLQYYVEELIPKVLKDYEKYREKKEGDRTKEFKFK